MVLLFTEKAMFYFLTSRVKAFEKFFSICVCRFDNQMDGGIRGMDTRVYQIGYGDAQVGITSATLFF